MLNSGNYSLNPEYLFYKIYQLFVDGGGGFNITLPAQLADLWFWLRLVSIPLSVFLVIMVVRLTLKILALRHEERLAFRAVLEQAQAEPPKVNPAWQKVLDHLSATNPNEWKLGIIEADNLLDSLVKTMGYQGDGLGERLKNVEPSDFKTLQNAWEAHKVRNRIAHESGYVPTEHEARQAIANYRAVFEEFAII